MSFEFVFIFAILFFCAVWLFLGLTIYFIPVVIAYVRKHNNIIPIALLTIFIGWTFLGWLAALLWSLNSDIQQESE